MNDAPGYDAKHGTTRTADGWVAHLRSELRVARARIDELEREVARLTPREPAHGQNLEADIEQVYGALRVAFYAAWKKHFPGEAPRPMGPEAGHARTACRHILNGECLGDVTRARNMARVFAGNMFLDGLTTRDGMPWRWSSVAKDPGRFIHPRKANPGREKHETAKAAAYDRKMARAEAETAPVEVGRAALAAIKGQ